MKKNFSVTTRISLSLVCLSMSLLLTADTLGLIPNERLAVLNGRSQLCESIAINSSLLVMQDNIKMLKANLNFVADRNSDILSIAIREESGDLLVEVGDHASKWQAAENGKSTENHMFVPIIAGDTIWGTAEIRFRRIGRAGFLGYLLRPEFKLLMFMTVTSMLVFYGYLRTVLRQLNPSKVIPPRVRSALDSLAQGLVVLNQKERIVLANQSFSETAGISPEQLVGRDVAELPWVTSDSANTQIPHPWSDTIRDGKPQTGILLGLDIKGGRPRTSIVNSTPIHDDGGKGRGVLISLDDVTQLEEKKHELSSALHKLQASSKEIRRQNAELEELASRDPLTSCLNRRSFFEIFESHWAGAIRYGHPLSCMMIDIDHFKSINDEHGHSVGDEVLVGIAIVLEREARQCDVVCRYGGEEFAILMSHTDIDQAELVGERIRAAIEEATFSKVCVTASIGVSAFSMAAHDPQQMLDQADKCLYVAKNGGRNQVVRWDCVPENVEIDESKIERTKPKQEEEVLENSVPYQAVMALIAALTYRDQTTGEHCRRVADLCVATAEGLMSLSECYILENAALLHDIGKIGVPDSILLKPGSLNDDEWDLMRAQRTIGVEIIRASFVSPKLTVIVENQHAFYAGKPDYPGLAVGQDIPIGARILAIADAFDSMTSDRAYRKGRSHDEAFAELRQYAGSQFDPELVERFIHIVNLRRPQSSNFDSIVSHEMALSIGLQIERLAAALDSEDLDGLKTLASRLNATARKNGVDEIADKATALETALQSNKDLLDILETATDLMELCRSTQSSYLRIRHEDQPESKQTQPIIDA